MKDRSSGHNNKLPQVEAVLRYTEIYKFEVQIFVGSEY